MPLEFNPNPYLQVWQARQQREAEEAQRPQIANQQILQGLQMLAEGKRQQQLMDMQKQQLAATQGQQQIENDYRYGKPLDPNIDIGMQGGVGQSRLFGNKPMNVGQGSSLIYQFNKFRAGGMKPAEARPEFMGAMGQDERKQFYDNVNPSGGFYTPEQANAIGLPPEMGGAFGGRIPEKAATLAATVSNRASQNQMKQEQFGFKQEQEEFKKLQKKERDARIQQSLQDRANLIISKVDQALGKVNSFTAGAMSGLSGVPFLGQATGARDLEATLDTVKAILGFEQLEQMKSQSSAGASGLGQLSDREMKLLTAARSNLDQAQTPEQLRARLNEVKTHFNNWLQMEQGINPYEQGQPQGQSGLPEVGGTFQGGRVKAVRRVR